MKTTSEIHDLIMECDTAPNSKVLGNILNILEHLNNRLAQMESEVERLRKEMGHPVSAETRAKMSAAKRGKQNVSLATQGAL